MTIWDRPTSPSPPARPDLVQPRQGVVEFSDDPVLLSDVGLRLNVPVEWEVSQTRTTVTPGQVRTLPGRTNPRHRYLDVEFSPIRAESVRIVTLTPPDGALAMHIHTPRVQEEATSLDVLAQALAQRVVDRAAAASGASAEAYAIFEKEPDLVISGRPAFRFYMRTPRRNIETGLVLAYTLLDLPGPEFLVLELATPEEQYLVARPLYETVTAAIEFIDPGSIDDQRRALMLAASRLVAGLSQEDYLSALARADGRMERLYVPGGTGADRDDQERGVRRVFCWSGVRGEIDPDKPRSAYQEADLEEGYLVFVGGRYFESTEHPTSGEPGLIIADLSATYWMSHDRQREAWLSRMRVQTPFHRRHDLLTEIGAREGEALTVWINTTGRGDRTVRPVIDSVGYISQVETFLFADLLAAAQIPADFGYYAWQSAAETCRFIHDSVIPQSGGLGWTIRRVFGDYSEVHHITFDGELRWIGTRREIGHGVTRGQPTDRDRLAALWRTKRLPLDEPTPPSTTRHRGGR